MTIPDAALLDLRGLEPAPERLLDIVHGSLDLPVSRIVIDWGLRLPIASSLENRLHAVPESLPPAVETVISRAGKRMSIVLRSVLPADRAGRSEYRHLERAGRPGSSEWNGALGKLAADVVDALLGLMPGLCELDLVLRPEQATLFSRAAAAAGLACRCHGPAGSRDGAAAELSGIEERLQHQGHPARLDLDAHGLHEQVRGWRSDGWMIAAELAEAVAAAVAGQQGEYLAVSLMKLLARHVRGLNALQSNLRTAYGRHAAHGAVERFLRRIAVPLREEHGMLAARLVSTRSLLRPIRE